MMKKGADVTTDDSTIGLENDLDHRLAQLGDVAAPSTSTTRIGLAARAAFENTHTLRTRPVARTFDRLWTRGLEPALLTSSSVYYLVWLYFALLAPRA
jgi:hypothetical protein